MALVYEQARQGPATHALVIGVGAYDHLKGGTASRKLSPMARYGNLGQLTSPAVSACAFAQHLITSDPASWVAPLATVDLLVAPAPGQPDPADPGGPYEKPTRDALQVAFEDWWERCDGDAGNVAVLYFCGHGLQGTNQILLASDFGRASANPWMHSIDINRTRQAFKANKAHVQIFLIDACREVTTSNVEVPTPNAPPFREPELRQTEHCRHDLTIQATSRDQKAYGPENGVSFFTAAMLEALRGGAGKKENGEWWIKSEAISARIKQMVDRAGGSAQTPVVMTSEPTRLFRLSATPTATLEVRCDPLEATEHADLAYWRLGSQDRTRRPQKAPDAWRVPIPAGFYGVSAEFAAAPYSNASDEVDVVPPFTGENLRVL